jgi:hypothetical protein
MIFVNAAEAQRLNAAFRKEQKSNEPQAGGAVKPGASGAAGPPHRFF